MQNDTAYLASLTKKAMADIVPTWEVKESNVRHGTAKHIQTQTIHVRGCIASGIFTGQINC